MYFIVFELLFFYSYLMLKYSSINNTADRQLMMKNQNVNFWTQIQREDLMRNEY